MSVPDHLIEKAAKALAAHDDWSVDDWDDWDDYDRYSYMRHARAALEAVAGELRAEGARAERERIAEKYGRTLDYWRGLARRLAGSDAKLNAALEDDADGGHDDPRYVPPGLPPTPQEQIERVRRAERERIAAWIEQESQAPVYKADDIDVVIRSLGRVIRREGGTDA